jgi:hypothetical protein
MGSGGFSLEAQGYNMKLTTEVDSNAVGTVSILSYFIVE